MKQQRVYSPAQWQVVCSMHHACAELVVRILHMILTQVTQSLGVPRAYIRMLCELEDFLSKTLAGNEGCAVAASAAAGLCASCRLMLQPAREHECININSQSQHASVSA